MLYYIVIVEDEFVIQVRLQVYFEQEGYSVLVIDSGVGLCDIMEYEYVLLILLDINFFDENGLMLIRVLCECFMVGIILVMGCCD